MENNKLILKTQKRFKSERCNVFIKKIIALSWNDDKRMQSTVANFSAANHNSASIKFKQKIILKTADNGIQKMLK